MTSRNELREDLVGAGYSVKYLDDWQPKTTLYRHKPQYNIEGQIVFDVGSTVEKVPGNPEYVLRKARLGLFNKPPSDTCECRWCKERLASSTPKRDENGKFVKKQDNV